MRFVSASKFLSLFCLALFIFTALIQAEVPEPMSSEQTYLYRTTFVRAAPGKLLELIDLFKKMMPVYETSGDKRPFWWRHTQGDQWDLMMLYPMESFTEYFSKDRIERRNRAHSEATLSQEDFLRKFQECSSWHEDIFVKGPPLDIVESAFKDTSFYHCEIFIALPGKHAELFKEREMENDYQRRTDRVQNLIFTRVFGASWDIYTLGCYKDMDQWAAGSSATKEERDAAAVKAGFEGSNLIGPYMRTLILMHRDTVGVAIR